MEIIHDRMGSVPDGVTTAVAIGVFDGVHLGHQSVIEQVRRRADAVGAKSAIVTFDQHPALVLRPENAPKLLTTLEQRLELLELAGIDYVYLVNFTKARSVTPPEDFIVEVVVDRLHATSVTVGADFHFGHGRDGNLAFLEDLGLKYGFEVAGLTLLHDDDLAPEPISSTVIRRMLAGGKVALAAEALGRNYEVRGTVIEGDHRGREIGFPTANIPVDLSLAWPADGVYAGRFTREDGERFGCAVNIGRRPTFFQHAEHSLLEAHVLDFDSDLYGETVGVEFVEFLRSEQRFDGIDALAAQLKIDIDNARTILNR